MSDEIKKDSLPQSKDGLALVVGGLFILALVFAAYNYFNKQKAPQTTKEVEKVNVINKEEPKGSPSLNGEGAQSIKPATQLGTQPAAQVLWTPNNYNKGDISGASYTVKYGDTLWEIAEGVYGNGAEWTKILEANKASVGLLPSGQQALIFSGQTLVLP